MKVKKINLGTPFNKFYTFLGYCFIALSFGLYYLSYFENRSDNDSNFNLYILIATFLLLFSILLSFTTNRIKIDLSTNTIFNYIQILFIKLGSKKNLNHFKFVSILSKRMKFSSSIISGNAPLHDVKSRWNVPSDSSDSVIVHDVVLLDVTHRKKMLVNRFETFEEAKEFASSIANIIQKPLAKYNPKRISKTR